MHKTSGYVLFYNSLQMEGVEDILAEPFCSAEEDLAEARTASPLTPSPNLRLDE